MLNSKKNSDESQQFPERGEYDHNGGKSIQIEEISAVNKIATNNQDAGFEGFFDKKEIEKERFGQKLS